MSQRLPEFIAPLQLVELHRSLEGKLPLSGFSRLADSLYSAEGLAEVAVTFGRDGEGRPCLTGKLRAELELVCQRCLGRLPLQLDLDLWLGLVETDDQARRLPEKMAPLMVSESPMSLSDIGEDELILALPDIPVHPPGICEGIQKLESDSVFDSGDQTRDDTPFAVLESLKGTRKH